VKYLAALQFTIKPRVYAIQHIPVPIPSQDKWGGLWQEGHPVHKWGIGGGGLLISMDGVAPTRIVSVSVSCCPP